LYYVACSIQITSLRTLDDYIIIILYTSRHERLGFGESKGDVRRSIKLANFCGRGLAARDNRPIKSLNYDTRPILSFATSYDIS